MKCITHIHFIQTGAITDDIVDCLKSNEFDGFVIADDTYSDRSTEDAIGVEFEHKAHAIKFQRKFGGTYIQCIKED